MNIFKFGVILITCTIALSACSKKDDYINIDEKDSYVSTAVNDTESTPQTYSSEDDYIENTFINLSDLETYKLKVDTASMHIDEVEKNLRSFRVWEREARFFDHEDDERFTYSGDFFFELAEVRVGDEWYRAFAFDEDEYIIIPEGFTEELYVYNNGEAIKISHYPQFDGFGLNPTLGKYWPSPFLYDITGDGKPEYIMHTGFNESHETTGGLFIIDVANLKLIEYEDSLPYYKKAIRMFVEAFMEDEDNLKDGHDFYLVDCNNHYYIMANVWLNRERPIEMIWQLRQVSYTKEKVYEVNWYATQEDRHPLMAKYVYDSEQQIMALEDIYYARINEQGEVERIPFNIKD